MGVRAAHLGLCRHPIFDQLKDLDVIVSALDDCACFERPKFSIERLVFEPLNPFCFMLVFGPNLGCLLLGRRRGLVGHFLALSATFPLCQPLEAVGRLGEVAGRPPKVADGHFSFFSDIFLASYASCCSLNAISIHVYEGMNTSLWLDFLYNGGSLPHFERLDNFEQISPSL